MALLAEVCQSTDRADRGVKLRRYAEVGVPVYWVIDIARRQVEVYQTPKGGGNQAHYADRTAYTDGQDVPVIIDGREVGRLAVADVLPAKPGA